MGTGPRRGHRREIAAGGRTVLRKTALIQLTLQPGVSVAAAGADQRDARRRGAVEADFVSEATQADPKIPNVSYFYTIPMTPGALAGISVLAYLPNGAAKPGVGIPPSAVIWQAGKAWILCSGGFGQVRAPRDRRRGGPDRGRRLCVAGDKPAAWQVDRRRRRANAAVGGIENANSIRRG